MTLRCAVHHALMDKMFTYIGCHERMVISDGHCSNSNTNNSSSDSSGHHASRLPLSLPGSPRYSSATDNNNNGSSSSSSMVFKLRNLRMTANIIHSNSYTASQIRMLEIIFEGLKDTRYRYYIQSI